MDSGALPSLLHRWGDRREAQGWVIFQGLSILGGSSWGCQDLTVQRVKRKENMEYQEMRWYNHGWNTEERGDAHTRCRTGCCSLPHWSHFEALGMCTLILTKEPPQAFPRAAFQDFSSHKQESKGSLCISWGKNSTVIQLPASQSGLIPLFHARTLVPKVMPYCFA